MHGDSASVPVSTERPIARAIGLVSVAAVAVVVLLRYDVALMRWRDRFMPADPSGLLEQLLTGFRNGGQVLSVAVALAIVVTYDRRRRSIVAAILLAQLFAAIAYNAGKYTIPRVRPTAAGRIVAPLDRLTGAETWLGLRPGNSDDDLRSFPSGHSAAAFALAGVLAFFYPRLSWMFWLLAVGCSVSRFLDAAHWPTDCLVGAIIGMLAALLARRSAMKWFSKITVAPAPRRSSTG
ncbi:MAG: phosphatase PAP2 family protein [Phycisphaerae bacterium]